jgi:hypothetical protein
MKKPLKKRKESSHGNNPVTTYSFPFFAHLRFSCGGIEVSSKVDLSLLVCWWLYNVGVVPGAEAFCSLYVDAITVFTLPSSSPLMHDACNTLPLIAKGSAGIIQVFFERREKDIYIRNQKRKKEQLSLQD